LHHKEDFFHGTRQTVTLYRLLITRTRLTVLTHRILFYEDETNSCITQDTFPQGRDKQLHHAGYFSTRTRQTVAVHRIPSRGRDKELHHTGYFSTRTRETVASRRILFHEDETNSCSTQDTLPRGRDKQLHHTGYFSKRTRQTVASHRILFYEDETNSCVTKDTCTR
jgi:hypothetical protein